MADGMGSLSRLWRHAIPAGLVWSLVMLAAPQSGWAASEPVIAAVTDPAQGNCRYDSGLVCTSADGQQQFRFSFLVQFGFQGLFVKKGTSGNVAPGLGSVSVDDDFYSFAVARGRLMLTGQYGDSFRFRAYLECVAGEDCAADQMWGSWKTGSLFGIDFGQFKRQIALQHSMGPTQLAFVDEAAFVRAAGGGLGIGIRPYMEYDRYRASFEILNGSRFSSGPNEINGDLDRFNYTFALDARLIGEPFDWDQFHFQKAPATLQARGWVAWETLKGDSLPSIDFGGGRTIHLRGELVDAGPGEALGPNCPKFLYLSGSLHGVQQCTGVNFPASFWDHFYGQGAKFTHTNLGGSLLGKLGGASLLMEANYRHYTFAHSSESFGDFAYLIEGTYLVTPEIGIGVRWEQVLLAGGDFPALLAGRDPSCTAIPNPPDPACPKNIPGAPQNMDFRDFTSWGASVSYFVWKHRLKIVMDYLHYELPWKAGGPVAVVPGGANYPKITDTSLAALPSTGKSRLQKFQLSGDSNPEQVRAQVQVIF